MTTNSTLFIGVSQLDLFAPYQGYLIALTAN